MKPRPYPVSAQAAIKDPVLQAALANLQQRLGQGAAAGYQRFPEGPELRLKGHDIRLNAIDNLDILLEALADKIGQNGGHVHFAPDAQAAVDHCIAIARRHDVSMAVKGKSMLTEEIGLNPALEAAGIETVETDLGEYIVQLAGEAPSHIIAPAIHKSREAVGRLFRDKLGIPYTDDPPTLTLAARRALRKKFLQADMGISGCNLACAQTGHITTLSNEGNIRMATTLPRVHVAFMGMERIVADLADHDVLLRLLSMGAAAQDMAGYVSYIGGPAEKGRTDGPDAFHLIIVDNGRSRILADPDFREVLCCIRCGACLNMCPVYGKIGGHAYASAYSGPVGAVVTPLLTGINRASDLCLGESLCGACMPACPVNIDLPRMLLLLRAKLAEGDASWDVRVRSRAEQAAFTAWSYLIRNRFVYDLFLKGAAIGQRLLPGTPSMIRRLPFAGRGWTHGRDLKRLAARSFIQRYRNENERRSMK
ncbi:iron-sulfur cluster-binding protein [Desulfosarcina alkanivorans]|uniref:Iron-sulfur cluster-binding protein n=1 Tax=Desulfosarcina alkanivorans TaxID=571177 RepID=A0A5K7YN54_9BACT|nr:LutB/LldF family L-lactate oxidation iron-sulfur protein [Desulfosarcina alkanivorans]BBO70636.1 iron-sulfur cluster-binding protein [Desulfosarcina alkanivorans]